MTTLTIHPVSEDQETAIRIFLDALHVDYKATEATDDTAYLLSSAANAAHLQKSIEQAKNGEVVKLGLDDIWKP
ncbi:MAG: hypothetical protein ACRYFA_00350 [Janthinobacterium lividum]